jgi:hypothetical protein
VGLLARVDEVDLVGGGERLRWEVDELVLGALDLDLSNAGSGRPPVAVRTAGRGGLLLSTAAGEEQAEQQDGGGSPGRAKDAFGWTWSLLVVRLDVEADSCGGPG